MHLPWIKGWDSGRLINLYLNLNKIYKLDSLQKTVFTNHNFIFKWKVLKKCHLTIQITNNRPVYILPLVNYNVYWPFIGYLYCMMSFYRHYKLLFLFQKFYIDKRSYRFWGVERKKQHNTPLSLLWTVALWNNNNVNQLGRCFYNVE